MKDKTKTKVTMWPVYQYGDHPKGTATLGEMAGSLMHGNPKTKVMRLNNSIRCSKLPAPKPVGIIGGRVGGLSFIYNVKDMLKWRQEHITSVTSKTESVMRRAVSRADSAKQRATRAKETAAVASHAKARYRKYVKMREQAEKADLKEIL